MKTLGAVLILLSSAALAGPPAGGGGGGGGGSHGGGGGGGNSAHVGAGGVSGGAHLSLAAAGHAPSHAAGPVRASAAPSAPLHLATTAHPQDEPTRPKTGFWRRHFHRYDRSALPDMRASLCTEEERRLGRCPGRAAQHR